MNNQKELFKSFIIGSSIISYLMIILVVIYLFKTKEATFNYYRYSIIAPIGIGMLSLISKYIYLNYDLTLQTSYLIVSIISSLFVMINISRGKGAYKFKTKERWYLQYLLIMMGHLFMYNRIIYPLDQYL